MWSYFIYIGAGVRSQLVPSDGICILCFFQNLISLDFRLISGCFTPVHSAISSVFFFFLFCDPKLLKNFDYKRIHLIYSLFLKHIVRFPTSVCLFALCSSPKGLLRNPPPKQYSSFEAQFKCHLHGDSVRITFTSKLLGKFLPTQTYTKPILKKNNSCFHLLIF